jgi:hypothetical protein
MAEWLKAAVLKTKRSDSATPRTHPHSAATGAQRRRSAPARRVFSKGLMVEPRGIEPATHVDSTSSEVGTSKPRRGPSAAQVGRAQGDGPGAECKGRTEGGQPETDPGLAGSTTGAQHPERRWSPDGSPGDGLSRELRQVIAAWPTLPEAIRRAIVAIVEGTIR